MQQPELVATCGRTLGAIDGSLGKSDRAVLRARKIEQSPLLYGEILRRLPASHPDDPWMPIVRALGALRHNVDDGGLDEDERAAAYARSVGYLLGSIGYSEPRMTRLLTASGTSLVNAAEDALQRLTGERAGACRLNDLAVLVLGDALGDRAAKKWAKRRIAIAYSRGVETRANSKTSA